MTGQTAKRVAERANSTRENGEKRAGAMKHAPVRRSGPTNGKKKIGRLLVILLAVLVIVLLVVVLRGKETIEHQSYPLAYEEIVEENAQANNLPTSLIYAVIRTESSFRADAESHANAKGLMQITPDTFDFIVMKTGLKDFTMDQAFDPEINIYCGSWYLRFLLDRYEQNLPVALAAYNAGMGNVGKWLKDEAYSSDGVNLHTIPFPETENYVKKVMDAKQKYEELYGA